LFSVHFVSFLVEEKFGADADGIISSGDIKAKLTCPVSMSVKVLASSYTGTYLYTYLYLFDCAILLM